MSDVPPEKPSRSEPPTSRWDRVDAGIYSVERSLVVGALLVMTLTYVLTVVWSNMTAKVNTVDKFLLKVLGHADAEQAPDAAVAMVTGWVTPLVVGVVTFGLVLLALRTRAHAGLEPGQPPPPPNWPRRLVVSLLVTVGLFVALFAIREIPSRFMGLAALAVMLGFTFYYRHLASGVASMAGAVVGAGCMAAYFVLKTVDTYAWKAGLGAALLMYIGFLGASMATRDERHIRVDAIRKSMKTSAYFLYEVVSLVVTVVFTAFLLAMSLHYLSEQIASGTRHIGSDLPLAIVVFPIVFAFVMMIVRFSVRAVRCVGKYRRGELPDHKLELV
ncbi:MAG: TRAP transporter small permease subunit [Myxococcales bacterium]|nr:TRAP transporter small permease subunit [Myxococcales bacterium]MCB9736253.1 TRAP transporter small permease subunit [Deltaproteobacteria bacterium]